MQNLRRRRSSSRRKSKSEHNILKPGKKCQHANERKEEREGNLTIRLSSDLCFFAPKEKEEEEGLADTAAEY